MASSTPGLAEEQLALDEAATIAEFIAFLKEASSRRHPTGPIRRFNQGAALTFTSTTPPMPIGLIPAFRTIPASVRS